MKKNNDRLAFLVEKFNVFDLTDEELVTNLHADNLAEDYQDVRMVEGHNDNVIAYVFTNTTMKVDNNGKEIIKTKYNLLISDTIFNAMVSADPTKNKINTQWMLNVFSGLLKEGEDFEAVRFAEEDLPQAEEYLQIFEANKRKKKFKEYSARSYVLKDVDDPCNINQYTSLSQLYDAVDPFIVRDPSEIEKTLERFVSMGDAFIPVKDRKFTVFVPLTTEANVIFDKFASWCTARSGNGMFKSYTENHKKPNGEKSNIYIVIDHKFFDPNNELENNFLYQIHFETNQVRNRNQSGGGDFYENVITKSEGVANYFNSELTEMAKEKFTLDNNKYLDYLVKFGWTQAMFDLMSEVTPIIKLIKKEVPKLANMKRFSELRQLIICESKMTELHESIGSLTNLESLALSKNKIQKLPKEIGNLKNLTFINLLGNPIRDIPEEIKYLDKSNGGSLVRIAVKESDIGQKNYKRLKKLLPSTMI